VLRISGCAFNWKLTVLKSPNITHLELGVSTSVLDGMLLLEFLRNHPLLEELTISLGSIPPAPLEPTLVELPHLKVLLLRTSVEDFLWFVGRVLYRPQTTLTLLIREANIEQFRDNLVPLVTRHLAQNIDTMSFGSSDSVLAIHQSHTGLMISFFQSSGSRSPGCIHISIHRKLTATSAIVELSASPSFASLHRLSLTGVKGCSQQQWIDFFKDMPSLENLHISSSVCSQLYVALASARGDTEDSSSDRLHYSMNPDWNSGDPMLLLPRLKHVAVELSGANETHLPRLKWFLETRKRCGYALEKLSVWNYDLRTFTQEDFDECSAWTTVHWQT